MLRKLFSRIYQALILISLGLLFISTAVGAQPDPIETQEITKLKINLATQSLLVLGKEDLLIKQIPVSTGRRGYPTPPGQYSVRSKARRAYSQKYEAMMLNWMAISRNGEYGIHALQGKSYERHLGRPASHGCIRVSFANSVYLYNNVIIGTEVEIVYVPKDMEKTLYREPVDLLSNPILKVFGLVDALWKPSEILLFIPRF